MEATLLKLGALLFAAWIGFVAATGDVPLDCRPRDSCCKVCSKGQACGNSCISRDKTCHQPPGCACDAVDVCR